MINHGMDGGQATFRFILINHFQFNQLVIYHGTMVLLVKELHSGYIYGLMIFSAIPHVCLNDFRLRICDF